MLDRKSMKRGDSTIEIALSIVMAVIVLYLILNLFSGNISTIVKNSGLYKATHKDNSAKTSWDPEPTKTQVNVEIVADQGTLAQYRNDAASVIERYEMESHTEVLSSQNLLNLAKQLTVFAESGGSNPMAELYNTKITGTNISYYQFGLDHGVRVTIVPPRTYVTTIGNKAITWGDSDNKVNKYLHQAESDVRMSTANIGNSSQARVQNVETILQIFERYY